jgi:ferredoxin-type protein NapH
MTIANLLGKRGRISWYSSLPLSFLFFMFAVGFEVNTPTNSSLQNIGKIVFIFIIFAGSFLLFYLKKGSVVRLVLFLSMAVIFVFSFMSDFFLQRGHIGFTENDIANGIPFCHLAIINSLLSAPILKSFVSCSNLIGDYGIYPMIIIWVWATILIGKGWCSWGCFYGGWDSMFGFIRKKPLLTISENTSKKLRFIPFAMMIVLALSSMLLFVPVFCSYLCPFKTITEFQQVTGFVSWIVFMVTVMGFFVLCILLPLLYGRRVWCTYVCPFSGFQSIMGKVFGIFKLKIDKLKCIDCRKCVKSCKACGITAESLKKTKFTSNCSLCGRCIEECPNGAINVSIFGNTKTPSFLIDKINTGDNPIASKIKTIISKFVDDMLHPVSILYFFGLTVLFNFFSVSYFNSIKNMEIIIRSIIHG